MVQSAEGGPGNSRAALFLACSATVVEAVRTQLHELPLGQFPESSGGSVTNSALDSAAVSIGLPPLPPSGPGFFTWLGFFGLSCPGRKRIDPPPRRALVGSGVGHQAARAFEDRLHDICSWLA